MCEQKPGKSSINCVKRISHGFRMFHEDIIEDQIAAEYNWERTLFINYLFTKYSGISLYINCRGKLETFWQLKCIIELREIWRGDGKKLLQTKNEWNKIYFCKKKKKNRSMITRTESVCMEKFNLLKKSWKIMKPKRRHKKNRILYRKWGDFETCKNGQKYEKIKNNIEINKRSTNIRSRK